MTAVALSHGYPPAWNMGGEVSLHRSMRVLHDNPMVLTQAQDSYVLDGVRVEPIHADDVLDINTNPAPIAAQLEQHAATVVIGQNELSLAGARAARSLGIPSVVNVHTPPRFGSSIQQAMPVADHAVYNTHTSAVEWGEPEALVLHPPTGELPAKAFDSIGDAYTLLSSLRHKGAEIVLDLGQRMPDQRFIIVRSPAESTHGVPDLEERAAALPNVELHPRVEPDEVAHRYLSQTRILLVPGRYETYGMSAIEAAGFGIPSVHVDTPHAREGIGEAAVLVPGLDADATHSAILTIEARYEQRRDLSRARAEWISARQTVELEQWADHIATLRPRTPQEQDQRRRSMQRARHRR